MALQDQGIKRNVDGESSKAAAVATMEEVYTVKVKAQPDAARLYPSERRYSASTVGGLGAVHLALAGTCILLAGLDMAQSSPDWTGRYGGGAWLGIAAGLAGLTGILAWRRWYIDHNIRWFFICSCVAGVTAVLCLVVTATALAATQEDWTASRLHILSSLKEPHSTVSNINPVYSASENPEDFEVQRSLRNAELSATDKDLAFNTLKNNQRIIADAVNETSAASYKPYVAQSDREPHTVTTSEDSRHHFHLNPTSVPKSINKESEIHPQITSHLEGHNINFDDKVSETSGIPSILTGEIRQSETDIFHEDTTTSQHVETHHIAVRQVPDETHPPNENLQGRQTEDQYTSPREKVSENPSFNSEHIFQDGNVLYLHRNHDESIIQEDPKTSDNETNDNDSEQTTDKSIFHKHLLTIRGGETRFVIVINLLVASILEIAWSILSAKIAWKGMKSGYPDDGPPRTDSLQSSQSDELSKEKTKSRNKKLGGLRRPDIISNHDGGKQEYGKKPSYKDEKRYPTLPMQESPTEYQERVRRFLASNSLATIDGGTD